MAVKMSYKSFFFGAQVQERKYGIAGTLRSVRSLKKVEVWYFYMVNDRRLIIQAAKDSDRPQILGL